MNYLAHLLLSGDSPLEQLGNLAGDFAKGPLGDEYHPEIRRGLMNHRAIDAFTDRHPVILNAKARFPVQRRRVAGILIDLSFDHFLSNHWNRYCRHPMTDFVQAVYQAMETHGHLLPERLQRVAPLMVQQNWLLSYGNLDALGKTIDRVANRLSKPSLLVGGVENIRQLYPDLEADFHDFFPEVMAYAESGRYSAGCSSVSSSAG